MVRGTLLGWHTTAGRGWALCCFFFLFCFLLITPQSEQSKKKKPINLSLTVLLTFSSFSLCALLHTWVLGDGRWGTKPHYPEKVLSPPSKETQKDHLGAMKQINKSLLLRARWLPLTQQMLRSNVLPKRVLLSDIARTSLSPTGCFPEGEENESWLQSEMVNTQPPYGAISAFPVLTLHEIRVVFTLGWPHSLPGLFPPSFENMAGKWCRQVDTTEVLRISFQF